MDEIYTFITPTRHDSEKSVSFEKITGMFVLLIEKMLEGLLDSHLRHFRTFASSFRKSATNNFDFQEKLNVKFCQGILIHNFIHKVVSWILLKSWFGNPNSKIRKSYPFESIYCYMQLNITSLEPNLEFKGSWKSFQTFSSLTWKLKRIVYEWIPAYLRI